MNLSPPEEKDQNDNENEQTTAARVVTPSSGMRVDRDGPENDKDDKDDQKYLKHLPVSFSCSDNIPWTDVGI
jgi:hypothetical protein